MKPLISIIVCTYNGERTLAFCLSSIMQQSFRNFEVLCIDGGSRDATLSIINSFKKEDKRIRLLHNKQKLPEGKGKGKWLGFKQARGSIIGIIDQDNIIQTPHLFTNVMSSFRKEKYLAGILGGLACDHHDSSLLRYIALFGTDSFFAYRSLDFLRNLHQPPLEHCTLSTDTMPLTGGNCFFYKKAAVQQTGGYDQDILVIQRLIKQGNTSLVILPNATKHYAERSLFHLIKKKFRWGAAYFNKNNKSQEHFNYIPQTKNERRAFIMNLFSCLLIFPNFLPALRIYRTSNDPISFLFPFIAFFTMLAYTIHFLKQKLS